MMRSNWWSRCQAGLFVVIGCLLILIHDSNALLGQEKQPPKLLTPGKMADDSLQQLFLDYHEQYLILFPLEATMFGDFRYNDLMPIDISEDFINKKRTFFEKTLMRLTGINRNQASDTLRLAADILEYELKIRLEGITFHPERTPCNQFEGLPLSFAQLGSGSASQPFKSVKDYENWLHRMEAFLIWVDVAIENFRQGMSDGYVLPSALVSKMITQCEDTSIVTETAEESLYFEPIKKLPKEIPEADQTRLRAEYIKSIEQRILPAYRRLGEFLRSEYLPVARQTAGLSDVPKGRDQYRYLVRYWTTTDMSPEEIFALGETEVARILNEMEQVKNRTGHQGDLKSFFHFLRTDPSLTPFATPEEVLDAFRSIQNKIEPHLDGMFVRRPKTLFEIRRTEAFREKTASAEYMPGTEDGSRPGIFYVPIPDAKKFNVTSGMESLFLHEALPGHHFQMSLQQENQALPKFARFLWYGSYGEGWGLYCESLGPELGLYEDPKQLMGALSDEMHRAIRLVVDVGLHWKGWSRSQAIDYMMEKEPITEEGAIAEIERYMAIPAQALSYKVGSLKIREWRTQYEKRLGDRFSLAEFHHQLLKDGSMPLSLLQKRLEQWAEQLERR